MSTDFEHQTLQELATAVRAIFGARVESPAPAVAGPELPAPSTLTAEGDETMTPPAQPALAVPALAPVPAPPIAAIPVPTIPLAEPATEDGQAPQRKRENLAALQEIAFLED